MFVALAAPLRRYVLAAVAALHLLAAPSSPWTCTIFPTSDAAAFGVATGTAAAIRMTVRSVGGSVRRGSGMDYVSPSPLCTAPPPLRPQLLPTTTMKAKTDRRRPPMRSSSRLDAFAQRDRSRRVGGGVGTTPPATGADRASAFDVAATTRVGVVVRPNEPFRDTGRDEVSVASFNALAPSYNSLGLPEELRADFEASDRDRRVPLALAMAKRVNADVLCLQEVELMGRDGCDGDVDVYVDGDGGDSDELEESAEATLRQLLSSTERVSIEVDDNGDDSITSPPDGSPRSAAAASRSTKTVTVRGYDAFLWCPLHPRRTDDPVGLCVAWRSDRHELVSYRGFRRGMVVQLAEKVGTQREEQEGRSRNVFLCEVNGATSPQPAATAGGGSRAPGPSFCVGNVHLPAKPRDVMGRINVCSVAIRHMEELSLRRHRVSVDEREGESHGDGALDGTAFLAGDFNCAIDSPAVNLLSRGYVKSGIPLEDRNYRHRALTKVEAYKLRHYRYRFRDPYGGDGGRLRKSAAPVTVSLVGRGPGVTDHVLFSPPGTRQLHGQGKSGSGAEVEAKGETGAGVGGARNPLLVHRGSLGRRRRRRMRSRHLEARPPGPGPARRLSRLRVDAVLATVDPADPGRTSDILSGLPNAEGGFPSDHLAVGALFSPAPSPPSVPAVMVTEEGVPAVMVAEEGPSSTSAWSTDAFPARTPSAHVTRMRHDALVRAVTSWLVSRGATDFIRDKPLYKWKWVQSLEETDTAGGRGHRLGKRSRAPDLCCVSRFPKTTRDGSDQEVGPSSAFSSSLLSLKDKDGLSSITDKAGVDGNDDFDGALIMVEITVVSNGGDEAARSVRKRKRKKYRDLAPALSASPVVTREGLLVPPPFVIVVPATGRLPRETEEELECLALLTSKNTSCYEGEGGGGDDSSVSAHDDAKRMALDLLRVRDHWNGANESRKLTSQARK